MSVKVCIPVLKELPEKEPKHRMNREERANGLVSLFIQQKQKQEINVRSITISTLRSCRCRTFEWMRFRVPRRKKLSVTRTPVDKWMQPTEHIRQDQPR